MTFITIKQEDKHIIQGIRLKDGTEIHSNYVMLAPGRDGSAWLTQVLKKRRLKMYNNQVDVGVRVETSDVVMREINEHLYEGKFIYNTLCRHTGTHLLQQSVRSCRR